MFRIVAESDEYLISGVIYRAAIDVESNNNAAGNIYLKLKRTFISVVWHGGSIKLVIVHKAKQEKTQKSKFAPPYLLLKRYANRSRFI